MRSVKRTARSLMMVILVCLMLTATVFAAGTDSVWLNVTQDSGNDGTAAMIVSGAAITDGQVELTYDAAALTYGSTEINDACVAMYAVNTDTEGVVKIAWVAAGDHTADEADWLIRVNFTGCSDEITLSGTMNTAAGAPVELAPATNSSELKAAVEAAQDLKPQKYTVASYSAVKAALKQAEAVLADPAATQEEIDEATAALNNAIDALEKKGPVWTRPGQGGSLIGKIKDWIGNWFKPGNPTPTEPTVPETTVPETTVPETTAPGGSGSNNSGWGKWFDWIGKWFRWGK